MTELPVKRLLHHMNQVRLETNSITTINAKNSWGAIKYLYLVYSEISGFVEQRTILYLVVSKQDICTYLFWKYLNLENNQCNYNDHFLYPKQKVQQLSTGLSTDYFPFYFFFTYNLSAVSFVKATVHDISPLSFKAFPDKIGSGHGEEASSIKTVVMWILY